MLVPNRAHFMHVIPQFGIVLREVRMPWTLSLHLPCRHNVSILSSFILLSFRCSYSSYRSSYSYCEWMYCSLFMRTHKYQIAVNSRVSSELCLHLFVESCCFILFWMRTITSYGNDDGTHYVGLWVCSRIRAQTPMFSSTFVVCCVSVIYHGKMNNGAVVIMDCSRLQ